MLGSFWLLAGTGHDYEVSAGPAAALRGLRAELRRRRRRQARPADVVARRRGELLRGAPARRLAARALRAARADGGWPAPGWPASAWRWSAAGALLAWPDTAMSTLPTFLPVFACGMAAAALAHRRVPSRAVWWALMAAGAALVCAERVVASPGHRPDRPRRPRPAGRARLRAPGGGGGGASARGPRARALRGLGTISYGLYLWHLPVLLWLRFQGLMPGGFVLAWLEVAALSALVALASWVFVERPAIEAAGAGARGRGACRPSRPSGTSGRCRAWRERRDDRVRSWTRSS